MRSFLIKAWRWLGGIRLTVVILLLLCADTAVGYLCLDRRTSLFQPLNDVGLLQWTRTYAWHNPAVTAWLFVLFGLLAFLAANTFVCTTNRVAALIRFRSRFTPARWLFRFAPHVMHYALLLILLGYLCSYLIADVRPSQTLIQGATVAVPGAGIRLKLESADVRYYEGGRLDFFKDRAIHVDAHLVVSDGEKEWNETISVNRPIRYGSYGIFLKNFSPAYKMSMIPRTFIEFSVRRDPGVWFYFSGMALFLFGLAMYLCQRFFLKGDEAHAA